jgi:hypothetical protein
VKDDRQLVVSTLANALHEHQPAAMFIDSTFGAAVAVRFQQDGAIDPADHKLAIELASPGFHLNKRNKLLIESKSMTARGLASPDRADALCLTFAMPVSSKPKLRLVSSRDAVMPTGTSSWMGP